MRGFKKKKKKKKKQKIKKKNKYSSFIMSYFQDILVLICFAIYVYHMV